VKFGDEPTVGLLAQPGIRLPFKKKRALPDELTVNEIVV
jgi:hypothetical protein